MLSLDVRGGLNNQRECVINGAIAASELNLTFVLPKVHPVGRGNEKYAPKGGFPGCINAPLSGLPPGRLAAALRLRRQAWPDRCRSSDVWLGNAGAVYEGRYADRRGWARWESLFNASEARAVLSAAGVHSRLRAPPPYVPRVALPAVEAVFPDCLGARKVGGTCVAQRAGGSGIRLMRGLLERWRGIVAARQGAPTLYDARGSLCWNAYGARNKRNCTLDFPRACHAAYAAANAWNGEIVAVRAAVHRHIRGLLSSPRRAASGAAAEWAAVHVRIFGCAPAKRNANGSAAAGGDGMRASLEYSQREVARLEAAQGAPFRVIYLVSSVPVEQVAPYFPAHRLTSKEAVFPRASHRLPFEVCAAVDYSIATAAPVYVGMRISSFDVFAHAERREAGLPTVMRPGGKICR